MQSITSTQFMRQLTSQGGTMTMLHNPIPTPNSVTNRPSC